MLKLAPSSRTVSGSPQMALGSLHIKNYGFPLMFSDHYYLCESTCPLGALAKWWCQVVLQYHSCHPHTCIIVTKALFSLPKLENHDVTSLEMYSWKDKDRDQEARLSWNAHDVRGLLFSGFQSGIGSFYISPGSWEHCVLSFPLHSRCTQRPMVGTGFGMKGCQCFWVFYDQEKDCGGWKPFSSLLGIPAILVSFTGWTLT